LGKVAVLEWVNRCGKLGAKHAYVLSSQQFYFNIGFYPYQNDIWWVHKKSKQIKSSFLKCMKIAQPKFYRLGYNCIKKTHV
jgi:N-acetylglutamate synthase-like GNAT family acetyltransferase